MKKSLTVFAKNLRQNQTNQERKLWHLLKAKRFQNNKFRRQFPIGRYIVDFCCPQAKLVIELDGGQHNENDIIERDMARDKFLEDEGYKILRVWNNEVDNNIEGVFQKIFEMLV